MFVFKPGESGLTLRDRVPITEIFEEPPDFNELCKKVKTLENIIYRDLNNKRRRPGGVQASYKKSKQ